MRMRPKTITRESPATLARASTSSTGRASCWATTTPAAFPESCNLFDSDQRSSFQEAYWVDASYEALGELRSRKGSAASSLMACPVPFVASPIFAFAVDLHQ